MSVGICCIDSTAAITGLQDQLAEAKVVDPCQDLVFLGIRINTVSGVLSLDPSKAEEVVALLDHSLEAMRLSKDQFQRLAGKLSWASNVVTWGRAHLWHIFHSIRRL